MSFLMYMRSFDAQTLQKCKAIMPLGQDIITCGHLDSFNLSSPTYKTGAINLFSDHRLQLDKKRRLFP